MNTDLNNVSRGIGLINIHTTSQLNESSYFNNVNWVANNGDVSGGHFFMNIHTLYEVNNHNYIYSTKQRGGNVPNVS